jgi:hypothetical protein
MTYSDDGVRVSINGQLLIDNWTSHGGTWDWNWVDLQAGQLYDIQIEYFQGTGGANLQLWWQSPSQTKEIVPQSQLYSGATQGSSSYFVSPSGNDSNSGLSSSQAWQSISRVNQQLFGPGDSILFERGGRYVGSLQPQGSGSQDLPISLGAYGGGALPVIDGTGHESAVMLFNQQYWRIDSLDLTGSQRFGVFISGNMTNQVLHYIRVTNLVVHDLYSSPRWDSGLVMIAPIGDRLRFDDVVIDGVTAYNTNLWYGIHVGFNLYYAYPTQPPLSTNVTIRNSQVHSVYGDGITVAQSQNVLIEKNVVYETGLAPAGISYTPNAIWSWQCDQTLIQFNEGYSTHSYGADGGVFDIDWGSTNTTIQYNYAHDAQGYCVAIIGAHNVTTSNSIVRFNICSNNGRSPWLASSEGDVFIITFDGGSLDGVQVYNNTAYWSPASDGGWLKGRGISLSGILPRFIKNNIVYSTTPSLIDIDDSIPLDRNLYWLAAGGTALWKRGSTIAASFSDFKRLTGQDSNGIFADPQLNDPTYSGVGMPLLSFTLKQTSPAVGAGASWANMGSSDFFGNVLAAGGSADIGADHVDGIPAPTPAPSTSASWVQVVSKNSGKCLDIAGISTSEGAPLQQWTCWGGDNQKFQFTAVPGGYEITARNSGLQLEVAGGPAATTDGVGVIQWPYWGGSNEIWKLTPVSNGYFSIVASHSGKCLDVAGISPNDGALLQQWSCWGGDNQTWQLVPIQ